MPERALVGRRTLVVEDEYFLADTLSGALGAAGANWVDEGKAFVVHMADHGLMA